MFTYGYFMENYGLNNHQLNINAVNHEKRIKPSLKKTLKIKALFYRPVPSKQMIMTLLFRMRKS